MRRICFCCRSRPNPKSSTPALLLTTVKSFTLVLSRPEIKFSGIPHSPKPDRTQEKVPVLLIYRTSKFSWLVTSDENFGSVGNVFDGLLGIGVESRSEDQRRRRKTTQNLERKKERNPYLLSILAHQAHNVYRSRSYSGVIGRSFQEAAASGRQACDPGGHG